MITFDWHEVWTVDFLANVRALESGSTLPDEEISQLMTAIARNVGGPRFRDSFPDVTERTDLSQRILLEAMQHVQAQSGRSERPGYRTSLAPTPMFRSVAEEVARLNVNTATIDELESLPGIGAVLAQRIVEERRSAGPFQTLAELGSRVEGIGNETLADLGTAVRLVHPLAEIEIRGRADRTVEGCYAALARSVRRDAGPNARLRTILELLAITCAENPHPRTRLQIPITVGPGPPTTAHQTDWVSTLNDVSYYFRVKELIDSSVQRVDVAMFHIAFTTESHPSRDLLDGLIEAKNRGVAVRVLVDRDREQDPYLSTVINQAAKDFLIQAGVECRWDTEDKLLHSKFLIIDDLVVIGSHNWSAGSYFRFDDWSVAINSPGLTQEISTRFDSLWDAATP